jgi:uncharacterized protein YcbK (DUF882 family)
MARRSGLGFVALVAALVGGTRGTQDAIANGDTRTITLYHNHTKESLTVTFRRNGQYDPRALEQLNWFLRDWRLDEPTRMDPRLFDTVWAVYREVGSSAPIHVNSAYRSPQTNAMLRRRSSAVAKNSQHMRGKAMDFYLPDASIDRIRAIGMRLQDGGVGYYPNAYTPFIHLDVGSVRAWPRMTRDQLVRLFPDGKTVHIPSDGQPLPRYEEARAEILAKGGTVAGYTAVADAEEGTASTGRRKSFWATLFGRDEDDEDAEEIRTARSGRQTYVARRTPPPNIYGADSIYAALQPNAAPATRTATRPVPVAQPEPELAIREPVAASPARREPEPAPAPVPATRIAGLPTTVETPAGPKLVWQQGATGQQSDGAKELAFAPIPPRRPEEITATGALAFAPMPPVRPGSLAASNPIHIAGAADLRSVLPAVAPASMDHPLPPPRPSARPIAVAALGAIPTAPAQPPVATPEPASREHGKDDRAMLRSLFSDAAVSKATAPVRAPAPTTVAKAPTVVPASAFAATPSLNMGFSSKPTGDLSTSRFTGPAVKPLPALR